MRIETIHRELFQFDELSEEAKEKARDWYRECIYQDSYDYEHVYDDAKTIGALMGISIAKIYFSGFASQGDGACFEGSYTYKKGSVKAVKEYAPKDEKIHRIAQELAAIQKRNFYKLEASVVQRGHYMHSGCTSIDVYHSEDRYRDIGEAEEEVKEALRDFMNWIYRQLESNYDYLMSNESVDENIRDNEYEFLEDGRRA